MTNYAKYREAIVGTIWAGVLALVVLASSIVVHFGIEWLSSALKVVHTKPTEYLMQVIDVTGAVGSGASFILLTSLQIIRLARDIKREVVGNEQS